MEDPGKEMSAKRQSPIEMSPAAFRDAGHRLVDDLAAFLESMPSGKVTESPQVGDLKAIHLEVIIVFCV